MNPVRVRREAVAAAHLIDTLKQAVLALESAVLAGEPLALRCQDVRRALAAVEGKR